MVKNCSWNFTATCKCIHEGLISCVRGPLFNTLETQQAVEAQLHKRILSNDCQRGPEVVKWTSGTCVMYCIPRVPSFPASVTCDLCSLSDRSVYDLFFFLQIVSFLNLTWRKERRCWRLRLRMLNSATEYEERYVEKELLGEGGFGKVGRTLKKQLMYQPIKQLVTF